MKQTDAKLVVAAVGITAILAAGVFTLSLASQSSKAFAQGAGVLAIETIPLEGLVLGGSEFIVLADTTPVGIESGHVAMNVPCEVTNGNATSNIAVVAGVAPNLVEIDPEYVAELSNPEGGKCTFHADIPQGGASATDVAIVNSGNETVEFESGNFAAISINAIGAEVAQSEPGTTIDEQAENTTDLTADENTTGLTVEEEGAITEEEAEEEGETEDADEVGDEDVNDAEDTDGEEEENNGEGT